MKKINKSILTLLLAAAIGLMSCGEGEHKEEATGKGETITMKGSDTVLPLAQKEAEAFDGVAVVGGGSGVGITALMDGTTDIAMASRDLKTSERLKISESGKKIKQVTIAFDALSVIVHPSNTIKQLTREQLESIFIGDVSNWKEVGGEDLKIVVYSRESSSGTYEFFKKSVMKKKNYANNVLSMPATGAIVQSISQTKGAIGYIGLAYETKEVKSLAVSYDQGANFVLPSIAAAMDKTYPISRPLFYIYDKVNAPKVQPFVDFALSAEGQKIVKEVGYVPLP